MNAFSGYNFSEQPKGSPLAKVIEDVLVRDYLREEHVERGLFLPLPFQTGIGKTYEALALILQEMLWQIELQLDQQQQDCSSEGTEQKKRTIIYMTDSVDNVRNAYLDLEKLIDSDTRFSTEQKHYLKQQVLYLPRQSSQLLDCSPEDVEIILATFGLDSDKTISGEWKTLFALKSGHQDNKKNRHIFDDVLNEKGQKLYSRIVSAIQTRQRSVAPVALTERQQAALEALIPGCRFEQGQAHVLFMTTQKYLAGFYHSKGKHRPIRDTKGQLLIIDEVDKQNGEILKVMVDKRAQDLIRAVRSLRSNLKEHFLETSPRYAGIEETFDPFRAELDTFYEKWHLACSYNTEGNTLSDQPVRLFSDRTFTHAVQTKRVSLENVEASTAIHQLMLKHDSARRKNLIGVEEKNNRKPTTSTDEKQQSQNLIKFVMKRIGCFSTFSNVCVMLLISTPRMWRNCR